jgi:hypothetical protein
MNPHESPHRKKSDLTDGSLKKNIAGNSKFKNPVVGGLRTWMPRDIPPSLTSFKIAPLLSPFKATYNRGLIRWRA